MADIISSVMEVKHIDELSKQKNLINAVHPLAKLLLTLVYIFVLASFDRYEVAGLLPFILYPVVVIIICDIPVKNIFKRVVLLEPFIIITGILNPVFDKSIVEIGGVEISGGWLTFFSLLLRSTLMITAGFLLVATTGIENIARALTLLRIPTVFVLLFLLTYRYIFVLTDEAGRLLKAYHMRAPKQSGVRIKVWGSMVGQLLIRTYNRAQTIYQSMILKGYTGRYNSGEGSGVNTLDIIYPALWLLFMAAARRFNIPLLLSGLLNQLV
ncbi:energy-coupling factor transporter transmembrane protein EcfT [Ruminiclostridium hungatei]|uniref:Energy-coupling factor transporter transmembrane protein EcfT n=1 Tax=Ruminiclostridium hungatei TaxID=48256 RepID=A0A1V4SKB6_RUMHU|nr:cobalt ECF transporter T component CbiQ [Ruminiclostridium hungatei]OPX44342.1 energy-coupling factor transporter transmembrane protein EcfT [Ruminiclostridium hungatei]